MGQRFSQFFPPAPSFTETSLPNLSGKVYIVTGASAGIGKELSRLLYTHNATVYLAARSAEKAHAAISWIKEACPESKGTLHYLHLDLDDLSGIKASAESFLAKESRLDVLFNNAGVMIPPAGSTTKQGYELQLGTNCVAPFLFTKLLTPILVETAKREAKGSVRVIWVSSLASQMSAPAGGVDMSNLAYKKDVANWTKYGMSKGGNVFHALEFQRKYGGEGVVSLVSSSFSLFPPFLTLFFKHFVPKFLCIDRLTKTTAGTQPGESQVGARTQHETCASCFLQLAVIPYCQWCIHRVVCWSRT